MSNNMPWVCYSVITSESTLTSVSTENRRVVARGQGGREGWTESLGLADANRYVQNG